MNVKVLIWVDYQEAQYSKSTSLCVYVVVNSVAQRCFNFLLMLEL
jgi:hypothetical protein